MSSYLTVSPLPRRAEPGAAVCFLLHFPWPRGRWVLPITVSMGARTFLPPLARARRKALRLAATGDHPVHSEPLLLR